MDIPEAERQTEAWAEVRWQQSGTNGMREYGLESPEYWDYIRKKALIYWMELSRHEIFEITELQPVP